MKRKAQEKVETPISSLIDVVFLLIIFFVVTAAIEKDVVDESIKLAQAKYVPGVETKDPRTITINIDDKGKTNIALTPMNLQTIQNILRNARTKSGNSVPILIRGDGNTVYRDVDRLVDAIGKAGLYRINLSAESTATGE